MEFLGFNPKYSKKKGEPEVIQDPVLREIVQRMSAASNSAQKKKLDQNRQTDVLSFQAEP